MRATPLRRRLPSVGIKLIDTFNLRTVEVLEIHSGELGSKGGSPGLPLLYVRDLLTGDTYGRCSIYFSDLAECA
jgi:hypothetical protein